MRKTLINDAAMDDGSIAEAGDVPWLDLYRSATVEITSEDLRFPIEDALGNSTGSGWRAAAKGPKLIRIKFDRPTDVRRIHLQIADPAAERSQEFVIYAMGEDGAMHEVVRQQFSFSPGGSSEEIEDYTVDLMRIITLKLHIDPDRAHDRTQSQHFAVLKGLRLA